MNRRRRRPFRMDEVLGSTHVLPMRFQGTRSHCRVFTGRRQQATTITSVSRRKATVPEARHVWSLVLAGGDGNRLRALDHQALRHLGPEAILLAARWTFPAGRCYRARPAAGRAGPGLHHRRPAASRMVDRVPVAARGPRTRQPDRAAAQSRHRHRHPLLAAAHPGQGFAGAGDPAARRSLRARGRRAESRAAASAGARRSQCRPPRAARLAAGRAGHRPRLHPAGRSRSVRRPCGGALHREARLLGRARDHRRRRPVQHFHHGRRGAHAARPVHAALRAAGDGDAGQPRERPDRRLADRQLARARSSLYDRLPELDFSRDLLEGRAADLCVLRVPPCGWSDLGTPRRVGEIVKLLRRANGTVDRAVPGTSTSPLSTLTS